MDLDKDDRLGGMPRRSQQMLVLEERGEEGHGGDVALLRVDHRALVDARGRERLVRVLRPLDPEGQDTHLRIEGQPSSNRKTL